MASDKLFAIKHAMKNDKKSEIFHSSGYAQAQSGGNMGSASTATFAARQEIDQKRRYVQGYKNARITNQFYGIQRAKSTLPTRGRASESSAGGDAGNRGVGNRAGSGTNRGGMARNNASNPMDTAMRRAQMVGASGNASSGVRSGFSFSRH